MKTKSRAFEMLKRNRKESWAYLLTLTLSASLLLVFINLQNDMNFLSQVTNMKDPVMKLNSTIALGGTTLVITVVCAMNCYVANTYFLKAKAQELCVYLSSGMNIVALAKYLIVQNVMILLAALPMGAFLAICMNPLINLIIYQVLGITGALFTMTWKGVLMWVLVLFIEIIYLFLINIGYAYKAELKDLLDEDGIIHIPDIRVAKMPVLLYPILLVVAFVGMLFTPTNAMYFSVGILFAFSGVKGCFRYYLPARRNRRIEKCKNMQPESMILSGNVHAMLKNCYMYILMIFLLVLSMSCLMVEGILMPYIRIVLSVSYILLLILMCASLFFKIMLEAKKRKQELVQLALVGLPIVQAIPILKKEILFLFASCLLFPLPFAILICSRFIIAQMMSFAMGAFLLCSYIGILFIVAYLSVQYYQSCVMEREGEQHE